MQSTDQAANVSEHGLTKATSGTVASIKAAR